MHDSTTPSLVTTPPRVSTAGRQALTLAGAAIGLAGGFATLYFGTLSVFLRPMSQDFGWSRAQTSAVTVLAMLGLALGAPLAGRLIDRHGAARVIPIAVVAFAACLFAIPHAPAQPVALAMLSLLTGVLAAATTPAGYLSVLPRVFDRRLGLALGVAMVGLGLGTVLAPLVTQQWISQGGWHSAYTSLAWVALVCGGLACSLLFAPGQPADEVRPATAARTPSAALPGGALAGDSLGAALRQWRFWLICAVLLLVSAAGLGGVVHVAAMFEDRGIAAELAARGVAITGVGVVLGRLIAGALMDLVHAPRVAAGAFLMGAAGLLLIGLSPSPDFPVLALGAFLFGFTIGTEGDFIPYLVRRYFGLKAFGAIFGVMFCTYSLGGVLGPILYGIAFDRVGNYQGALLVGALVCLVCAAAILAIGPYRYRAAGR